MAEVSMKLENAIDDSFDLDDIESMPKFVTLPTGAFVVLFEKGIEDKIINEGKSEAFQASEVKMKVIEVSELNPDSLLPGEIPPNAGDEASLLFNRENKYGAGNYKEFLTLFRDKFYPNQKGVTVGMIREKLTGLTALIIVKRTYGKDKDTKKTDYEKQYINIVQAEVL
jgi:hypothetical protein